MIINPAVGMRVVGCGNAFDSFVRNKIATIIIVERLDGCNFDFQVAFENNGGHWWCNKADFDLETPLTPEETAALIEQSRQAEEKRLDTFRRQQFAAKYL